MALPKFRCQATNTERFQDILQDIERVIFEKKMAFAFQKWSGFFS